MMLSTWISPSSKAGTPARYGSSDVCQCILCRGVTSTIWQCRYGTPNEMGEQGNHPMRAHSMRIPQPQSLKLTYKLINRMQVDNKLGCQHYDRNCLIQAPCCKVLHPCKLCHDDSFVYKKSICQVERMPFELVQKVKCLKCNELQPSSNTCIKCETQFGEYACLKCKLYENNPTKVKDIFHCDECGMCRRGTSQNTFHCSNCGYCRPITQKNKHKCTQKLVESNCPICMQNLKYSTKYYFPFPCGHLIHVECSEQYHELNCPVCGMAIQKLSKNTNKNIQRMINQTKDNLPEELKDTKVNVLCNECLHKTLQAPFHFMGIKCEQCGSFNTKMM